MYFNNQGQLNASSVKEALQVLTKYASILGDNVPSNYALSGQPDMNDEKRDALVTKAIYTQEGKLALAQAMANPIN